MLKALENWLLYHPIRSSRSWHEPPAALQVEDVELTTREGVCIHAWWTAPEGWDPSRGAMLYCHGNAGNVSARGEHLAAWHEWMDTAVLIFDYPGYGRSAGRPSEAGCYAAADAAYDWMTASGRVPASRMIVLGRSLGAGVAVELARRRPIGALVLYSPFTSFPDLAQEKCRWPPTRRLVRNRFDNLGKIGGIRAHVFIAHGTADTLAPARHGERLHAAAPAPKRFLPLPGRGHNGGFCEDFYLSLHAFLEDTGKDRRALCGALLAYNLRPLRVVRRRPRKRIHFFLDRLLPPE
ncbi:MAG TPA: alpha/beta hydrolase [Gemmataceae bacterium]|nr:alpha/beta hydrolase [Gemmataceae bacterium]